MVETPKILEYFFRPLRYNEANNFIEFNSSKPNYKTWYGMFFSECMNICEGHRAINGFIIDYMGSYSYQVTTREITHLIMNCPPGCSKTVWGTVLIALYLGCYPDERITVISATDKVRNTYKTYIERILNSEFYKYWFPNVAINYDRPNNLHQTSVNKFEGSVSYFSVGEDITGVSSDFVACDDIIDFNTYKQQGYNYIEKVNSKFSYLQTRLRKKDLNINPPMVLIMQRICKGDTTDFAIDKMRFMKWEQIVIPAIETSHKDTYRGQDPKLFKQQGRYYTNKYISWFRPQGSTYHEERIDKEEIEGKKEAFNSVIDYNYQYQQENNDLENTYFSLGAIKHYDNLEEAPVNFSFYVMSVDTCVGISIEEEKFRDNDFNCAVIFGVTHDRDIYLVDCEMNRNTYIKGQAKQKYFNLIEKYEPKHIIVEDANTGSILLQDIEKAYCCKPYNEFSPSKRLFRITPRQKDNKLQNAIIANSIIEQGKLYMPTDEFSFNKKVLYKGVWSYMFEEFNKELLNFPNESVHDDFVDSLTLGLIAIKKMYFQMPKKQIRIYSI